MLVEVFCQGVPHPAPGEPGHPRHNHKTVSNRSEFHTLLKVHTPDALQGRDVETSRTRDNCNQRKQGEEAHPGRLPAREALGWLGITTEV